MLLTFQLKNSRYIEFSSLYTPGFSTVKICSERNLKSVAIHEGGGVISVEARFAVQEILTYAGKLLSLNCALQRRASLSSARRKDGEVRSVAES